MAGFKFRVLLDSKDEQEVFRDIWVSENHDFEQFYRSIMEFFEFKQEQMASFYMSNDSWDKGFEISLFDMTFGDNPDEIQPAMMNKSFLRDYVKENDQKMILVHDFMRMWIFLIELIDITVQEPLSPELILSVGKAPNEESKPMNSEDLQFETYNESGFEDADEDEFGFGEFEDGYDEYDF